eukprot:11951-Heterococcus_DN1.PRE.3
MSMPRSPESPPIKRCNSLGENSRIQGTGTRSLKPRRKARHCAAVSRFSLKCAKRYEGETAIHKARMDSKQAIMQPSATLLTLCTRLRQQAKASGSDLEQDTVMKSQFIQAYSLLLCAARILHYRPCSQHDDRSARMV